jgi:hypothetical protein
LHGFFNAASSGFQLNRLLKTGDSVKLVSSLFSNPEPLKGFAATSEVLPVIIMNMSKNLGASFSEIQKIVVDRSSRIGSDFKELNMDAFNAGIFTIWKELYRTDFQKFYNIPQLGLTRNYQEQITTAMDKGNQFFMAFSEFMNLLYIPVEKANTITLEKYQQMVENKEITDDGFTKVMGGEALVVEDVENFDLIKYPESFLKENIPSILSVPIKTKTAVIGIMNIYSGVSTDFFKGVVEIAEALAIQGGIAIQNASLYLDLNETKESLEQDIWGYRSWF